MEDTNPSITMVSDNQSHFPEASNASSHSAPVESSYCESRLKRELSEIYGVHAFPRVLTVQSCRRFDQSYCRSLLLAKHGFPLWYTQVATQEQVEEYIKTGTSIGDVGCIDEQGSFKFFFNIFLPADHPIHAKSVPEQFEPLVLDPSEIIYTPDYFKPGTIIASSGVKVIRRSADPLSAVFTSSEPEGGILILPHGASRADLVMSDRIHEHIRRNALYWYQQINPYEDVVAYPNGSLVVVTGCDKAFEYGNAAFYANPANEEKYVTLEYTWRPEFEIPWYSPTSSAAFRWYQPREPTPSMTKNQCVFVRTTRISLNSLTWAETLPLITDPSEFTCVIMERRSLLQRFLHYIAVLRGLKDTDAEYVRRLHGSSTTYPFHPNAVLAQLLLHRAPDVNMTLIDDSVWCNKANGGPCTLSNIHRLVSDVLYACEVVETNGCLSLKPAKQQPLTRTIRHLLGRCNPMPPRYDIKYVGDCFKKRKKPEKNSDQTFVIQRPA